MSLNKAVEYLKKYNLDDRVIVMQDSSATVELAAKALGCREMDIAKTMSFSLKDKNIVIVMAGDVKIDNSKFKSEFHEKAHMIEFDKVEELIGHPVGGVCPFGVNDGVEIYLDESLKKLDVFYPAAGSTNSAVRLTIDDLDRCTKPNKWIDVCKEK